MFRIAKEGKNVINNAFRAKGWKSHERWKSTGKKVLIF